MKALSQEDFQNYFLEMLCPLPKFPGGEARAFNADIYEMDGQEVQRERERVRDRLRYDPQPAPWLRERLAKLDTLIRRNHGN